MEFLAGTGLKPGAIKIKVGPPNLFEFQHVPIECDTPFEILYMDGCMIELINLHIREKVRCSH